MVKRNTLTKKQIEMAQNLRKTNSPQGQKLTYSRTITNASVSNCSTADKKQNDHVTNGLSRTG